MIKIPVVNIKQLNGKIPEANDTEASHIQVQMLLRWN